ncbi:MAG: DUF4856 domain-containing protein [Saprospiraceae bacterium]
MFSFKRYLLLIATLLVFSSCGKDDDSSEDVTYDIPTTYDFENVSYTGQTQRLQQLLEMKAYMGTSQTSGVALDADKLKAMYENDAANAGWTQDYEESKQIKGKTFEAVQEDFAKLMEELAEVSQSTVAGAEGVSGVIESADGAKAYLVGADGLDHAQVIEKGLMGALIYYQATGVYMEPGKIDTDNETVEEGKGTSMEHAFDEAFGYFGVQKDFPTNSDNLAFWGSYSNKRNEMLGSNQKMMDAFLKGRAAISNNDLTSRDEAIETLRIEWELISVGTALHYLNDGIANFGDMAIRSHGVSEAVGFIYSLQFNPAKKITNAQVDELLELIAVSSDFEEMDLYNITVENLEEAKTKLAEYYNLSETKDDF